MVKATDGSHLRSQRSRQPGLVPGEFNGDHVQWQRSRLLTLRMHLRDIWCSLPSKRNDAGSSSNPPDILDAAIEMSDVEHAGHKTAALALAYLDAAIERDRWNVKRDMNVWKGIAQFSSSHVARSCTKRQLIAHPVSRRIKYHIIDQYLPTSLFIRTPLLYGDS